MGDCVGDAINFKWWQYALLACILIIGFIAVYKVHWSYDELYISPYSSSFMVQGNHTYYPYPLHADEWTHLAQAQYIVNEHKAANVNPYVRDVKHTDLESGFHAFIASSIALTGLDAVMAYQYLAAFFLMLTMLSMFWFMYIITKDYFIAILAPAFLLLIRNNINIMGVWFFLPLTFSLFIIFMALASYFSKAKVRHLTIVFLIVALATYPLAAIMISAAIILYELASILRKIIHKHNQGEELSMILEEFLDRQYWKYYATIIIILATLSALYIAGKFNLSTIIFKYGWTVFFEHTYMPWEMYGSAASILALIGLCVVIFKKNRMNSIFWILPIITLVPILMYSAFRFTIFIPYQRAFFYLLIILAMLSAIGMQYLCRLIKASIKKAFFSRAIITAIVLLTFITGFINYYHVDDERFRLVHYAEESDYEALTWVKNNYGIDTRIMVDIFPSFIIYPLTGMQTVAVPPSNLEAGNIADVQKFFNSQNCYEMASIMQDSRADLIYSARIINCQEFTQVYAKNGRYVYEKI